VYVNYTVVMTFVMNEDYQKLPPKRVPNKKRTCETKTRLEDKSVMKW